MVLHCSDTCISTNYFTLYHRTPYHTTACNATHVKPHCTAPYHATLHHITTHHITPHYTAPHHNTLRTTSHHTILHHTISSHTTLHQTAHHNALYCISSSQLTTPYHISFQHTTSHHIRQYHFPIVYITLYNIDLHFLCQCRSLFEWSQLVARQEPLKQAIDYVIGSLCHVCPSYFQLLLHLTDAQELVDQARTQNEFEPSYLVFVINRSSMETLGRACQSHITSHLLLASGLLNVLHDSITRLCNNLLASRGSSERSETNDGIVLSLDYLSDVLSFMSVCTEEPVVKTWCGESGRDFWKPLMLLLGSGILFSPMSRIKRETPPLGTRHRIALESATIKYFSQCISCHPDNQNLFSRLLCEVMETPFEFISTTGECMPGSTRGVGLDGFLRRLVLEALLQDEKVKVCIQYGSVLKPFMASQDKNFSHSSDWHPRFGAGYNILLIRANLSSTIEELDEIIHPNSSAKKSTEGNGSDDDKAATYGDYDDLAALGDADILEGLSIAAGINVKSKRAKSSAVLRKISSQKLDASLLRPGTASAVCRHNALLGNILIQNKTSLTSLLSVLMSHGLAAGTNCIELSLKTCGNPSSHVTEDIILNTLPLPTALHKFASFNGLAILSSRLSCSVVMNQPAQETASSDSELALPLAFPLPLFSLSPSVLSRIPGHSLAAFGLFISLPGYADVLLRDRPKAQCLLRLLLGAEDDGNGGKVYINNPILFPSESSRCTSLISH